MALNLNSNHNLIEPLGEKSHGLALYSLMVLFFMMGFITCLNDILIPYLKSIFALTYAQANFINLCFSKYHSTSLQRQTGIHRFIR